MTQFMIDMMAMMMPYMKPIALVGAGLALAGLIAGLIGRMNGTCSALSARLGKIGLLFGLFFLACEAAGRLLGMEPTLLFANDVYDRALYRNQWPFWTIGLALTAFGFVVARLGKGSVAAAT